MFQDPVVRSVRVAQALCDRFEELLKGPTTVTASKQRGALVGVAGDQEGLSMRIGEAQQIYPEIWQHLDDARNVLATRGADTTAFDRIREVEGQALGANVGIEHHSYGSGSRGVDQQVKHAGFNTKGLGRARQACKAIVDATPEIDWKAIAAAEADDPAAKAFARSTRNKRYLRLAALALVIFAPFGIVMYMRHQKRARMAEYQAVYEPPPPVAPLAAADREAITRRLAEVRPQLVAAKATWATELDRAALARLQPGTAPCAFALQPPTDAAIDRYVRTGAPDRSFAASDFYSYTHDQPIEDHAITELLRSVTAIEARLAAGRATRADRDVLLAIDHVAIVDVVIETPGEVTSTGFRPGRVVAQAYVYSLSAQRVACIARLEVANLPPETSPYRAQIRGRAGEAVLHRELEVQLRQGLATRLSGV